MKKNLNNTIKLAEDLISIPSFREGIKNESLIIKFLEKYFKENIPWMSVELQEVEGNRKNIFIKDVYPTRLLVIDHIDSVIPSSNWETPSCKPKIYDGKLFGLGSSDTKGNIASFLTALKDLGETKGLAILLYVDEEYDFKGMKKYISSSLARSINPKYVFSIDGNGILLGCGCRGLIELKVTIQGEAAHSASGKGISVNKMFLEAMGDVEEWLTQFNDEFFGTPSFNIARINSGAIESNVGDIKFSEEGNKIPDYLESILEIRTTSPDLDSQSFIDFLTESFRNRGIESMEFSLKHDLNGFKTTKQFIKKIQNKIEDKINGYLNPSSFGYLDISLLKDIYPESVMFSLGIGTEGQAHKANEYIEIENLFKGYDIYKDILNIILN